MAAGAPQQEIQLREFTVHGATGAAGAPLVTAPSVTFRPGTLHAIIGPNGAGKTSLLRGLVGILRSSGGMLVGSQPFTRGGLRARTRLFAYQPQVRPDADGITVEEFVLSSRTARAGWLGSIAADDLDAVQLGLTEAGALPLAHRMLETLSGGEAARVSLAATLAHGGRWLLLDEPVAACDVSAARAVYTLLRGMIREGRLSVVVVEHDLGLARSFADDVTVVAKGRVAASGTAESIFAGRELERVYQCAFRQFRADDNAWAVVAVDRQNGGGFPPEDAA
jgi:ABC-type cobalamin/Fe3+-siderophores transport system ATPase subunit